MRLNKKSQYALLFVLYLHRSGLVSTPVVAENLGVSQSFLEQIARSLRVAGLIGVKRGPGGGYHVIGQPTVMQVLAAIGAKGMSAPKETFEHAIRGTEGRTLNHLLGTTSIAINTVFSQPVIRFHNELIEQETRQLNTLKDDAVHS
jgi:Rrf2 family protein